MQLQIMHRPSRDQTMPVITSKFPLAIKTSVYKEGSKLEDHHAPFDTLSKALQDKFVHSCWPIFCALGHRTMTERSDGIHCCTQDRWRPPHFALEPEGSQEESQSTRCTCVCDTWQHTMPEGVDEGYIQITSHSTDLDASLVCTQGLWTTLMPCLKPGGCHSVA